VCKLHVFEIVCSVEFDVFNMCKCLRMYVLNVFNVLSLQVLQCSQSAMILNVCRVVMYRCYTPSRI